MYRERERDGFSSSSILIFHVASSENTEAFEASAWMLVVDAMRRP